MALWLGVANTVSYFPLICCRSSQVVWQKITLMELGNSMRVDLPRKHWENYLLTYLTTYLLNYLPTYLTTYLPVNQPTCLPNYIHIYLFIRLLILQTFQPSVRLPANLASLLYACLSFRPPACLSVRPSIYLPI